MTLSVLLLLACSGAPEAPAPPPGPDVRTPVASTVPEGEVQPPPPTVRIPPGATEVPEAYRCPPDQRGGLGCFRGLPGGTFLMGAQATDPQAPGYDPDARPEEGPVHEVSVKPFWILSWEVGASDYDKCVRAGWCSAESALTEGSLATVGVEGRGEHPAVGVTWAGAQRYCAWWGGRLPTEAEWEWAARGAEGRRWPWGNDARCPQRVPGEAGRDGGSDLDSVVDTCAPVISALQGALDESAYNALTGPLGDLLTADDLLALCVELTGKEPEVIVAGLEARLAAARMASRKQRTELSCPYPGPTPLGEARGATPERIYGLAGNSWEWTADAWAPYDAPSTEAEPAERAQRGGSWMSTDPVDWRGTVRAGMKPDVRLPDVGFRCVWTVENPL